MKRGKRVLYSLLLVLSVITALVAPSGAASATSPYDSTVTTAPNFVMACAGSSQTQDWSTSWFDKAYQAEATRKASDTSFDTRAMDYYLSTPTNIMVEMWLSTAPYSAFTMYIVNPEATMSFGAHSWWSKGMVFHGLTELRAITVFTNSQSGDPSKDGCASANLAHAVVDRTLVTDGQIVDAIGQIQNIGNGDIFYPNNPVYQFINVPITYPDGYEGATIPSSTQPAVTYVAMGDSFSSGEGVPSFETETDTSSNKCHRSPLAYPRLLQTDAALNLGTTAFVACSGATTSNVLHGGSADGAWGEDPQIDALSTGTDVVTITIGGNDVGFGGYAIACTEMLCGPGTFDYNYIMDAVNSPSFFLDLTATYESILDHAPNAQVYVSGYPFLATEDSDVCGQVDLTGAWAVQDQLNAVIKDAVEGVAGPTSTPRIHYVDPNESGSPFIGKHLCNGGVSDFHGLTSPTIYSLHPNADGQQDFKTVFANAIS